MIFVVVPLLVIAMISVIIPVIVVFFMIFLVFMVALFGLVLLLWGVHFVLILVLFVHVEESEALSFEIFSGLVLAVGIEIDFEL